MNAAIARPVPGPYKIDGQFDAEIGIGIYAGDLAGEFTQVCELQPFLDHWTEEEIAVAHLLKASWDLLEQMKLAVKFCGCGPERDHGHRLECFVPAAIEAIERAEGRRA